MLDRFITVKELARDMGVNPVTLYQRMRRKGIRPVRRVGSTDLYDALLVRQHFVAVNGRIYDLDKARMALASAGGQR